MCRCWLHFLDGCHFADRGHCSGNGRLEFIPELVRHNHENGLDDHSSGRHYVSVIQSHIQRHVDQHHNYVQDEVDKHVLFRYLW